MELPYYMTPLVGALAWAVIAGPKSGFINQLWKAVGRHRRHRRHLHPLRYRLGHGAVRGHRGLRHDLGVDEVDGSRARGIGACHGRFQASHHADRDLAAWSCRACWAPSLFVFAEMLGSFAAALVLGIPGRIYVITTAIWDSTLAYPPDYGRASAMGLSLFVVMFGMLTFYRRMIAPRQLRHHHRQGVPAAADGHGTAGLGAVQRLRCSTWRWRWCSRSQPSSSTSLQRFATVHPEPGAVDPRQLRDRAVARAGAYGAGQQHHAGPGRGHGGAW